MEERITISDLMDQNNTDCEPKSTIEKEPINISDVIGTIDTPQAPEVHNLYDHVPKSALEKQINAVLSKNKEYINQLKREKTFLREFEKKMSRLRRIKSKGYRKLRKKIKMKNSVQEIKHEEVIIPDFLLNEVDKKSEKSNILSFGDDDDESSSSSQRMMVKKVFDDEFGEEFKQEKEKLLETKEETIILPGWGSWGGNGLEVKKTAVNTISTVTKQPKRKDSEIDHIIFNEDTNPRIPTHKPKNLTQNEYKALINIPISKECNTARIFSKFVKGNEESDVENFEYKKRYMN